MTFRSHFTPGLGSFPKPSKPRTVSSTYEPIFEAILQNKPLTMFAHHVNLPSLRTQFNRWRKKLPVGMNYEGMTIDLEPVTDQPDRVRIYLRAKQTAKPVDYIIAEPVTAQTESCTHEGNENLLPLLGKDT